MSEYSDLIAADGYVALWKLDDNAASTTVVRTGSAGNNGTLTGGDNTSTLSTADAPAGIGGRSLHFNGSDDAISLGDSDDYTIYTTHPSFSAECWIKADTSSVGVYFNKQGEWALLHDASGGEINPNASIQKTDLNMMHYSTAGGATYDLNVWHHMVFTFDRSGNTHKHYVNGVDVTNDVVGSSGGDGNTTNTLYLGRNLPGTQWLDGYMSHAAIYHTVLTPTQILKHYEVGAGISTYIDAGTTQTIAFTAPAPTVSVEGTVNVTADLATVSFSAFAPTISIGIDISAPAAEVTFTAPSPTVAADNSNTFTCFDGTIYDFIGTFAYVGGVSSGASYDVNGVYFDPYVSGGGIGRQGYSFILTVPSEAALNVLVTITASATFVNNLAGNQGQINVYDLDGESPTTLHNAISLTHASTGSDSDTRALTLGNIGFTWVAGRTYRFEVVWERNGTTQNGSTVQLDSLTLYYETGISVTVDAPAAEVSFTKLDPTVTSGQQTILTVDNVPAVTAAAYDPDILTPGQVYIGTTTSIVSYAGLDPTLSTTQSIEQVLTDAAAIEYGTYSPSVDPNYTALSFKYISKNCPCRTAADSNQITSIDLGSGLFNQEKEFAFKLGNTSSSISTFVISASSVNNLEDMVTFSIDKYGTYTSSLTIESIQPNRVTDVIWGKLTIDTDAIIDNGTFLIHVEQTNA